LKPALGWESSVPALDNGELIWSIVALQEALLPIKTTIAQQLSKRVENLIELWKKTAIPIFYQGFFF
jgi:hypothetical protein